MPSKIPYLDPTFAVPERCPRPAPPPVSKPARVTVDTAVGLIPPSVWNSRTPDDRNLARRVIAVALAGDVGLTAQGAALRGLGAIGIIARVENGGVIIPTQPGLAR